MAVEVQPGAHVVHFYDHDSELAEVVGRHLADGLASGDVALVIATDPHRRAFEDVMSDAGIDVAGAVRDGALVLLDASATLACFMRDGSPEPVAFDEVVGTLVRRAAETGRRVRAYGEMVALLWDKGLVNAAMELEELWNGLADQVSFSLLCAYPRHSVANGNAEAFEGICRLHSGIVDSPAAAPREDARTFAASPDAPRHARRYVVDVLQRWGQEDLADRAAVVVTELATNAVVHARSDFVVTLRSSVDGLRISVGDRSAEAPIAGDAGSDGLSGRGLVLVDAMSTAWGTEPAADGKTVWAELHGSTATG
jgi:anti-sigma regulatory factor (Ser/Thr protein kinase)